MNDLEKQNIKDAFKDWAVQCIRRKAYPVLLIGMKDAESALVWKGGQYTNYQVKKILEWLAAEIPNDHLLFEGIGTN